MSTVQIETNSVARKGRTATSKGMKPSSSASSSKSSAAKRAGGQVGGDTQALTAASKVARKGGKAKGTPATVAATPSQKSRASGASGQSLSVTQCTIATRKVARKSRTASSTDPVSSARTPQSDNSAASTKSSRAGKSASKNKPRAIRTTKPMSASRAATNSDGQNHSGNHLSSAVAPSSPAQSAHDTHCGVGGATPQAALPMPTVQREAIASINDAWRKRQGLIRAMTKLSLQAQAILRSGREREEAAKHFGVVAKDVSHPDYPMIAPYLEAQEPLARYRSDYEKTLVQSVKTLPIYEWAKGVSGLGDVSLAGLIGECSGYNFETDELWSIGQMKSPSAMWKRLGLAVMSGVRQGDATAGLSKQDWVEHGYVKTRRSVVWNVGECIVKAQWRKENTVHEYGKFYGEEKARLQALNEAGEYAEQAARIVERMKKAGSKPLAENLAGRLTPAHINNRAKRHMTKRLIRDLWVAWREADRKAMGYAPVAEAA